MIATPRRVLSGIIASLASGAVLTALLSGPASVVTAWLVPSNGVISEGSVNRGQFGFGHAWSVRKTSWLFHERWNVYWMEFSTPAIPGHDLTAAPPNWVLRPTQAQRDTHHSSNPVTSLAAGWPFRAFNAVEWHAVIHENGARYAYIGHEYDHGWCMRPAKAHGKPPALVIPFRPIWSGLLANLAIWSAVSATAIIGIPIIRNVHRRRRRRCPACAYDRTGLDASAPCPECGKTHA